MNKKLISTFILSAFLLTGCADTESSESVPSDSVSENAPPTIDPVVDPADISTKDATVEETLSETEEVYFNFVQPNSGLMYNGELYALYIGSSQIEIDGKYYEIDGEEAFVDTERIRSEGEYIGKSIPNPADVDPTRELEVTYASSDVPRELYKIDENQILAYSTEDYEIPERYSESAIVYPGTYRVQTIYVRADKIEEIGHELMVQYYRYAERFPDRYGQETESEHNSISTDVE